MDELIALARDLAPEPRLTGEALAAALERAGWSVLRAGTGTAFPRVWQKGALRAGIQGDGPGDGLDYLHHRAWRLTNRTLLVGAIQHDNGLPVFVEAVIG